MRTLTGQESKVLATGNVGVAFRVWVADIGGTFRDLSTLLGRDWGLEVSYDDQLDQPVAQCTVTVRRDSYLDSLSPLNAQTRPNLITGSYAALIQGGAEFKVETATVPIGFTPGATDWREVFRGYIDEPEAADDPMSFVGRDLGGRLQDITLEADRVYGTTSGVAIETVMQSIIDDGYSGAGTVPPAVPRSGAWIASTAYALRDRTRPTARNGYWYRCTTAGTTSATQPTWPTTLGGTVTDGSVVWTCQGRVPTIYTPSASTFLVTPFVQKPEPIMSALKTLADLIGWEVRYRWRAGTSQFELTLSAPRRSITTPDYTWDADRYTKVGTAKVSINDIRNRVSIIYSDATALDATGAPTRKAVIVEDTASQDKYTGGLPKFMQIAEGATSQIDTSAEATALANAILLDLKDPVFEHSIDVPYWYAGEIGDFYKFTANGIHYTTDQQLAVVQIAHKLSEQNAQSTITCRGKPAAARRDWLRKEARPGIAPAAPFKGPDAPTGLTAVPVQGGFAVTFTPPLDGQKWDAFEVHASASSGFTPSAATLKASTSGTRVEVSDLTSGATRYVKVVPRDAKGNTGTASAEVSVIAGYTTPNSIDTATVDLTALPLNGGYGAFTLGDSNPPDNWLMLAGVWGTGITVLRTDSYSGGSCLKIVAPAAAAKIGSTSMPVVGGEPYVLEFFGKGGASQNSTDYDGFVIDVEWQDRSLTLLSTSTASFVWGAGGGGITGVTKPWTRTFGRFVAPVSAVFVRLVVRNSYPGISGDSFVDSVTWSRESTDVPQSVSYGTGWTPQADGSFFDPRFFKDSSGFVCLEGLIKYAAGVGATSTALTLPLGYRPVKNLIFAPCANSAATRNEIRVLSNGVVSVEGTLTVNGWYSLAGLRFRTDG